MQPTANDPQGKSRGGKSRSGKSRAGRPRAFNEAAALDAATMVFWQKGYEGASMADLTNAMQLNRPSLYGAFGNKEQLFLQALQHYARHQGQQAMRAFEAEPDIHQAVRAFLETSLDVNTAGQASGCLLANCAATSAETIPEVKQILIMMVDQVSQRLLTRFEQEPLTQSSAAIITRRLIDTMYAQALLARIGYSYQQLMNDLDDRVADIFRI